MPATRFAVVCVVVSALVVLGPTRVHAAATETAYGDALGAGWSDWSWGSTRNLASTSPVAAGSRAIAVTFQAWGGLYLRRTAGPVSGMATIQLSIDGGTAAGDQLEVYAVAGSATLGHAPLAQYCVGAAIPANAWTRCSVPLSALGAGSSPVDGFYLQEHAGKALPTLYVDELSLAPAQQPAPPSPPSGLAAAAGAGAVTVGWNAVSGATGYTVARATAAGGPFTALTPSPQAATSYRDAAVAAGATYWYQVAAVNAAGTSVPSAAVSATVPAAPPPQPTGTTIYADALAAGWSDWSWSSTRNFAATSPVASGARAISVAFQAWGGLYLHAAATASGQTTLELSVDGGAAAGDKLNVAAVQGSAVGTAQPLAQYCSGAAIPANAWTRCKVPLSALAPGGGGIDGVVFQWNDAAARTAMYLDDLALTGAGTTPPAVPAAPTNLVAAASAGAVSLSWTAVAGATGYDVYRGAASGGPFSKLTATPQAGTSYRDAAVTAGSTYWYQVAAVNAAGAGPSGPSAAATVPAAQPVTVTVSPASTTVDACASVRFTAAVTGSSNGAVTWSVQEGAAGGTIDATGNYTAPAAGGTYHLVARSSASSSAQATAAVLVQERILSVSVTPAAASVAAGGTLQLSATVTTTCGTFAATLQ